MVGGKAREIQGTFKSIGNVSLQEKASKPGAIEHPSWKAEDTRWEKHGTKQTRMMEDGGRESSWGKKSHSFRWTGEPYRQLIPEWVLSRVRMGRIITADIRTTNNYKEHNKL